MEMEMEMDSEWETGWEIEGPHIGRLEVFNLCFDYDVGDRYTEFYSPSSSKDSNIGSCFSNNKVTELPGHFRGKIFVGDTDACEDFVFTEIYNSDRVGSVYVNLTKEMQDDSDSSPQKRAKQNNGDSSTFGDTEEMQVPKISGASTINLPHIMGIPNEEEEEEEMQVAHEFSKSSGNLFNLPFMGPNEGMILNESFLLVIHNDTGNRNIEDQYEQEAYKEYSHAGYVRPDDVGAWRAVRLSSYDAPFEFHLYNDFRKLKMNCIVMKNTKVVDVCIKWCMPTSYICGEISVSCDNFFGNKCSLIQTPQNKFVMAEEGEFIKLCRFTVAVPYSSDFTVSAMLHDPNNALLVNESESCGADGYIMYTWLQRNILHPLRLCFNLFLRKPATEWIKGKQMEEVLTIKTSTSLKFTVLNPKGRIWTMVGGGGASVIYADTVGDLGYASELGNYAEYSGAPNEEEVLQYARVVIDCATADPDGRTRALVIGGGIANLVYGPEATMTGICKQAIECITVAA